MRGYRRSSEADETGRPKIVGIGTRPSEGLKRGLVINLEKTVESVASAVEDAEMMAGVKVNSVYAGIAGDHIRAEHELVVCISCPLRGKYLRKGGDARVRNGRRALDQLVGPPAFRHVPAC